MLTFMSYLKPIIAAGLLFLASLAPAAAQAPAAVLSEGDRADLARIEAYLNTLTTMESRFLQFSEQGVAQGRIFLDRPEHLRIEYAPPNPVLMVASDLILMFHDKELQHTTFLPVSETPAAVRRVTTGCRRGSDASGVRSQADGRVR